MRFYCYNFNKRKFPSFADLGFALLNNILNMIIALPACLNRGQRNVLAAHEKNFAKYRISDTLSVSSMHFELIAEITIFAAQITGAELR